MTDRNPRSVTCGQMTARRPACRSPHAFKTVVLRISNDRSPAGAVKAPDARQDEGVPEGDTVWNTARVVERALVGDVLTRSDFRVPQLATTQLSGWTVAESVSR